MKKKRIAVWIRYEKKTNCSFDNKEKKRNCSWITKEKKGIAVG